MLGILLGQDAADSLFLGMLCHRLALLPEAGRPRLLFLYVPLYALADPASKTWRGWAPLPEDIDPDLLMQSDLEAEIVRLLGHHTVAECCRLTLVPFDTVDVIAECLRSYQREAMIADGARPRHLAVASVALAGEGGARHRVLHVVACDPATDHAWTLAVLDWALPTDDIVACLCEAVADLPHLESLVALVTGSGCLERQVITEVVDMARAICPGFAGTAVVDGCQDRWPGQSGFVDEAVERLNQNLTVLWREAPINVERLEQRALARQGYAV